MTDRKSKKLKHDKVDYEFDHCYRSHRQFEGKTIIMYDSTRLLIPTNARKCIANELHKAHSGLTKMMKTATQLYYWPNMRTLLELVVKNCSTCQKDRPRQARPKMKETLPSDTLLPMNELGSDLYDAIGKSWLVLVDRYSGYVWNAQLRDKCTSSVTAQLYSWFTQSTAGQTA